MINCSSDFLPIKYGTFSFQNIATKTSVNVTPVKSDDGISIKYYQSVFEIEMVITNTDGTDDDLDIVKSALLVRGADFEFKNRGFGTTVNLGPATPYRDINFGPIPQILTWQPLGGSLACRVVWRLEAHTTACPIVADTSVESANQFTIVSLVEDNEISFDEEGAATITTTGSIEVAGQSLFLTPDALKKFYAFFQKNALIKFQRTTKLTVRKTLKTIDYVITDTEIKSDNPYAPYMLHQDVSHSVSSNLMSDNVFEGSGFTTWVSDMSGEFTVAPGQWKGWAWIAFCLYLANRRNRASAFGEPLAKFAKDEESVNAKKKIIAKQIPLSIRIKESLNSRKVSVNVRWVTHTSILNLFKATGMFYPVDVLWQGVGIGRQPTDVPTATPHTQQAQWAVWADYTTDQQSTFGYLNPRFPNMPLIFDICTAEQTGISQDRTGFYQDHDVIKEPYRPSSSDYAEYEGMPLGKGSYDTQSASGTYLDGVTYENSWLHYHNDFEIIEETNSNYIPTIESEYVSTRLAAISAISEKLNPGFSINGKVSGESDQAKYIDDVVQIRGKPIYKVRMTGYAMRVGFQIPAPVLVQANGQNCYRIGVNRWKHNIANVSDEVPVFSAMWDQEFGILGSPEDTDIIFKSTGKPAEFA